MKYIVGFSRLFVGILFIISGLIKLNDPLGFSYKLEEYFSADVLNIPFLEPYALAISLFVVIFEVVLGVFLLIGFKRKFTVWNLLAMIVFFTFLTFYSAYFDKVKDCGCFGDALKLTPWESFWKDIILLAFILILFFGVKHIQPIFKKKINFGLATISLLVCIWFGYHVLNHLPSKDFRAYKIGSNIPEGMVIPEDAPKPVIDYHWKFNVNGAEQVVTTRGSYPTVDGEYISVETETVEEGYEPPIFDFSIESADEDLTEKFLAEDNLVVVVAYSLEKMNPEGAKAIKTLTDEAIKKGYKVIGMSASGEEAKQSVNATYGFNFDFYLCDEKALKTVVRSNPGVLELNKGTVMQKVHWNDVEDFNFKTLPNANPDLNISLKRQLDSVMVLDQKYRGDYDPETWKLQEEIDSSNTAFIETVFEKHGYPGKTLVGESTQNVAWYVIQHSNKIPEYLPLMKAAAQKGELPMSNVAMMEDRYLMGKGEMQIYGTQGSSYAIGTPQELSFIWPIENPEEVNKRRKEVGFDETIEVYSKRLFGENFEYKPLTLEEKDKLFEAFNN